MTAISPYTAEEIAEIVAKVYPTGMWSDFTPHMNYWYFLKWLAREGYMQESDVPPQPVPADYY